MHDEWHEQCESAATIALDLGKQLLMCGADVKRAQDTVERICRGYGAQDINVFCIGSLLMATVEWIDGSSSTQIRNVRRVGYDLARLESLNMLSRDICDKLVSLTSARNRLTALRTPSPQTPLVTYPAAVVAVAAYTLFFGGTMADTAVASLCAIIVTWLENRLPERAGIMMRTVLCAIAVGIAAGIGSLVYPALHTDKVMIGAIMLMVPGLMVAGSLRDLLGGDIIAGSLQLIQAVLIAGALALGLAWAASWAVVV